MLLDKRSSREQHTSCKEQQEGHPQIVHRPEKTRRQGRQQTQGSEREVSENRRESLGDIKTCSMRDDLILGIAEERREDTEAILQNFLQTKYELDYDISYKRVHRMGKWSEFREWPRNIIVKSSYFKDREFMWKNAAKKKKKKKAVCGLLNNFLQKSKKKGSISSKC